MAGVLFAHDLTLDGSPYKARRVSAGDRGIAVDYVAQEATQQASVQLTPANQTTWHRGSGASLPMLPGMNAWTRNGWTGDPGLVLPGPLVTTVALPNSDGDVNAFIEQDGHLYVFAGRYVTRIPLGSGTPVAEQDLGVGFQTSVGGVRRFNGNFTVGGLATGFVWEKVAGGAWAQSTDTQRGALGSVFWTVSGFTAERMVGQVGSTSIRYVAFGSDPKVAANWVPSVAIDVGHPINSLVATRDHIYIATQGGLKDLDASGLAPNLTPEAEAQIFPSNGLATFAADGWIYYGLGYGLKRVRVTNTNEYAQIQDVSPPGVALPNETPVAGLPQALTRYADWMILAQWDSGTGVGGTTYINFGRDSLGGYGQYTEKAFGAREIGPMVWNCSPIVLDGLKVTRMHVSGLVSQNPRLWMGVVDGAGNRSLRWAPLALQTPYQDLRNGRPFRFASTFDLYESYEDWGDDAMPKIIPDLMLETEGLGAGATLTVSAAVDGGSSYDQLGVANFSPQTKVIPASELRGNRVQLKYTGAGTSLAPPILRKRQIRAFGRPDVREVRTYQLMIGPVRHVGGNVAGTNTLQQKSALARLQIGSSVTMVDEDGQNLKVLVASGIHFQEAELDVAQGRGERILAATVAVAILAAPGTTFKWDSGVKYDTPGKVWA